MLSNTSGSAGLLSLPPGVLADHGGFRFDGSFVPGRSLHDRRGHGGRGRLRVVNFVALSGSAGIWGPATTNSALLAASEINARGGILGREVEVIFRDAGCAIEDVVEEARDIIAAGDADVVTGSHTSAVRVALRDVVAGQVPYIYTPVYEGGERTRGVVAIGETPDKQSRPAIQWLANHKRASRWYLIGSDYVWPWQSHRSVKDYIIEAGGRIVGEEFVPMGSHDHDGCISRIRAARPDVVVISLIGNDSVIFNRAFAESGLASRMLRLGGAMDETILLGIGAENSENLFCASGYFLETASRANDTFLSDYYRAFGRHAAPPGSVGQSNYEGLRFLETAARQAQSLDAVAIAVAAHNTVYHGARGPVHLRGGEAHMPMYLAQADGLDFRVIARF